MLSLSSFFLLSLFFFLIIIIINNKYYYHHHNHHLFLLIKPLLSTIYVGIPHSDYIFYESILLPRFINYKIHQPAFQHSICCSNPEMTSTHGWQHENAPSNPYTIRTHFLVLSWRNRNQACQWHDGLFGSDLGLQSSDYGFELAEWLRT